MCRISKRVKKGEKKKYINGNVKKKERRKENEKKMNEKEINEIKMLPNSSECLINNKEYRTLTRLPHN